VTFRFIINFLFRRCWYLRRDRMNANYTAILYFYDLIIINIKIRCCKYKRR